MQRRPSSQRKFPSPTSFRAAALVECATNPRAAEADVTRAPTGAPCGWGEGGEHMALERWYSVAELHELTGWPKRTIYDAIERGELASIIPNGCARGMRVSESEWRRWCEERQRRA